MKGLLELSLVIGMIIFPILAASRKPTRLVRWAITLGASYYVFILYVNPRIPG
jgi:hypothetical protein